MAAASVPLSSGFGEILAPQTLIGAILIDPQGRLSVDPGALHGRSEVEQQLRLVKQRSLLANPEIHWIVWVAVELDPAEMPLRYKGLTASELLVDPVNKVGYKNLAEHVNRMAQAMRGDSDLAGLPVNVRTPMKNQLIAVDHRLWERTPESLRAMLEGVT